MVKCYEKWSACFRNVFSPFITNLWFMWIEVLFWHCCCECVCVVWACKKDNWCVIKCSFFFVAFYLVACRAVLKALYDECVVAQSEANRHSCGVSGVFLVIYQMQLCFRHIRYMNILTASRKKRWWANGPRRVECVSGRWFLVLCRVCVILTRYPPKCRTWQVKVASRPTATDTFDIPSTNSGWKLWISVNIMNKQIFFSWTIVNE